MRYFLRLAYDGTGFHGWQTQPNAGSVQQTIEEALATVLRVPTPIVGAGRTDTGVHARIMYAHFDTSSPIENPGRFEVAPDAHARFDATERSYKYFVVYEKSPFLRNVSWHSSAKLNIEAMNEAAGLLIDVKDFTSFAKLHSDARTNICDVRHASWEKSDNIYGIPGIVFTITADRFLRNMVRAVVGTLVDVGRGKLSVEEFCNIIDRHDRCAAGTSMPPQGLFLWDVKYPYIS